MRFVVFAERNPDGYQGDENQEPEYQVERRADFFGAKCKVKQPYDRHGADVDEAKTVDGSGTHNQIKEMITMFACMQTRDSLLGEKSFLKMKRVFL